MAVADQAEFDYVVVGSGAGGGPVAANLASAGFSVLLIEAGGQYAGLNYQVPGFHGQATQEPEMRWDFFVQHYEEKERQSSSYDSKYDDEHKGILYPRAGTLGGCTAHHALITIYPHESDWRKLSEVAKHDDPADDSWEPARMRQIFQRIERCGYVAPPKPGEPDPKHGYAGWLGTSVADPDLALADFQLIRQVFAAAQATLHDVVFDSLDHLLDSVEAILEDAPALSELFKLRFPDDKKAEFKALAAKLLDPNRHAVSSTGREGVYLVPISTRGGYRNGTRERILDVKKHFDDKLMIQSNTFVTKVVIEGGKAVGVEWAKGPRLYQAAPEPKGGRKAPESKGTFRVRREVILAGGTFNTPQLLMLSGIGPADVLKAAKVKTVVDLPAVGRYLQDRYEVGVITDAPQDFKILGKNRFREPRPGEQPDEALKEFTDHKTGVYSTNGAVVAIIRRSSPGMEDPDLFIFGLPAAFKGYFPGYADKLEEKRNKFTWAILKGHTKNKAGYVKILSDDPFTPPEINFKYFDKEFDPGGDDLNAMVEGVAFVRKFTERMGLSSEAMVEKGRKEPNLNYHSEISEFVRREAWGHHACGTCRIGPKDDMKESALDTNFRVKGVKGLRVVDASAVREIPGFFIVTPLYMMAEKASESILKDAGWTPPAGAGGLKLPPVG